MVSALLNDALSDPCSVIQSLRSENALDYTSIEFPARVAEHFKYIFSEESAFKQIPPLDISHPPEIYAQKNLSLVRFRAMIQDTSLSSEIYPSILENGKPGGWGIAESSVLHDVPDIHTMKEREVIWAISIPGESSFVSEVLDDETFPTSATNLLINQCQHKDPLMREEHVGLQVKIYDPVTGSLKPTDLYTFIGLLIFEHDDAEHSEKTPTLHTIFSVKHPSTLIRFDFPSPNKGDTSVELCHLVQQSTSSLRDELIAWIANDALGGDCDAALWVLLACISKVQSRQPPLLPISLTLSRFPKAETTTAAATQTPALVHILKSLLPIFVHIPLSLSLINNRPFNPESHGDDLHSGLLQLPAGCTVLISSGIQEGQINTTGVKNIQALRNVLLLQTIDYQFPFTAPYQFPTDLSFIILAEGKASPIAQTQITIPLNCKDASDCFRPCEQISFPSPSRLEAFRRLIGGAMTGEVQMTDGISEHIQADFVMERQAKPTTTADDLMIWMTIAKLLALSHHESVLTTEVWEEAKELDKRRRDGANGV